MAGTPLRDRTSAARKATLDASAFGGAQLRHAAIGIWTCQVVVAVVVLSRRLSGAIAADLPAIIPCLVSGIALAFSLLGAALFARSRRLTTAVEIRTKQSIFRGQVVEVAATFGPPLLLGIALLSGNVTLAVLGLTCVACTAALMWLLIDEQFLRGDALPLPAGIGTNDAGLRQSAANESRPFAAREELSEFAEAEVHGGRGENAAESEIVGMGNECRTVAAVSQKPHAVATALADEATDERVTQWMQRAEAPGGGESLSVRLCVKFAAGQQQETVHVPFSPPFARVPELFCETDEDGVFRLKAAAVHPYGARIEVRRAGRGDVPAEVEVHIFAHVEAIARSDAA